MPRRDPYAEVGTATRAVIAQALDQGAPITAWRVLGAVLAETTAWSRMEARVSRARLVELTGMTEDSVKRGIRWLREHEVLEVKPGYTKDGGNRIVTIYRLPGGDAASPPQGDGEPRDRGTQSPETGGRSVTPYENPSRMIEGTSPAPAGGDAPDEVPRVDPRSFTAAIRAQHLRGDAA